MSPIKRRKHAVSRLNPTSALTAALFTAHYSDRIGQPGAAADALGRTAASVFELLQVTQQSGQRELQLVQAQEAYVNPRQRFEVAQVR